MISPLSQVDCQARRWPAAAKLAILCTCSTALFFLANLTALAAVFALTCIGYSLLGREALGILRSALRMLLPFVLVLSAWHGLAGDYQGGAVIILRILTLFAWASAFTMTTPLSDTIELAQAATRPLERIGLPAGGIALAIPLTLRFVPLFAERTATMEEAWRARSSSRRKWRLFLPMLLSVMDDADGVADALRARSAPPINRKELSNGT